MSPQPTVAVLGGGIGGLSAAHELVERNFAVTVYEKSHEPGGKAKSRRVSDRGAGRRGVPSEHGFRFFPGFYWHLPDTMSRIKSGAGTVLDNLVATDYFAFAQAGDTPLQVFAENIVAQSHGDWLSLLRDDARRLGLHEQEIQRFTGVVGTFAQLSDLRRQQYDNVSWWATSGAATESHKYKKFLGDGLSRRLVAARGREISARTAGTTLIRLLADLVHDPPRLDRVLNGPTSEVWLAPWHEYLADQGVTFCFGTTVKAFSCDPATAMLQNVTVRDKTGVHPITADYYVSALPGDVMGPLCDGLMRYVEPRLGGLTGLRFASMNGVQYYLKEDVEVVRGHVVYTDSQFALTSISQHQFWPGVDLGRVHGVPVGGVVSVDVSDWDTPGLEGIPARHLTADQLQHEVWNQMKQHLNSGAKILLDDQNLIVPGDPVKSSSIDEDIELPSQNPCDAPAFSDEPLLINTVGSWALRPDAVTAITNLLLASDYVRTFTDLATMEAANEAARRAVNGILDKDDSTEPKCEVVKPEEFKAFTDAVAQDEADFKLGKPNRLTAEL